MSMSIPCYFVCVRIYKGCFKGVSRSLLLLLLLFLLQNISYLGSMLDHVGQGCVYLSDMDVSNTHTGSMKLYLCW